MKEVTQDEKRAFRFFWLKQRQAIGKLVSQDTMYWFSNYTTSNNVGYETGQLRPGKLGQWDLYYWLTDPEIRCDKKESMIASGLTAEEVSTEECRENLRQNFVDPDDPRQVAMHEHITSLTPQQLDVEIARLECVLANDEQVTA